MEYLKTAIATTFAIICLILIYMYFTFDTSFELDVALEDYQKGNYKESLQVLDKLKSTITNGTAQLYRAYVLRDQGDLEASTQQLGEAADLARNTTLSRVKLEIAINQALNAYLQNNDQAFQQYLVQAEEIAGPRNEWVQFFTAINSYIKGEYSQASKQWVPADDLTPLSPWMKQGFKKIFTPFWISTRKARSEMETGNYIEARQMLEKMLADANEEQRDELNLLIGLSYAREAQDKPENASTPYYKLAFSYFDRIPILHSRFSRERQTLIKKIFAHTNALVKKKDFNDLSFYAQALEKLQARAEINSLSKTLYMLIEQAIADNNWQMLNNLTELVQKILPQGELRTSLANRFELLITETLQAGNFNNIGLYWKAAQAFSPDPDALRKRIVALTTKKILSLIPVDNKKITLTEPYITFWQNIEKDHKERLAFAEQLASLAIQMLQQEGDEDKAASLLTISNNLPYRTEQQQLKQSIDNAITKLYAKAVDEDNITLLPYILKISKQLKLTGINFNDKNEINTQVKDAEYLFSNKNNSKALQTAEWVLLLDPQNQKAKTIAGMISYYEGNYSHATAYLRGISNPNRTVSIALGVSELLSGNKSAGEQLLKQLNQEQPLDKETYLRLGLGSLAIGKINEGIDWLKKIEIPDDEVIAGFLYAHYKKEEWEEVLKAFDKLQTPYNKIDGIEGLVVNTFMNLDENEEAEELLFNLLKYPQEDTDKFSPAFQTFDKHTLQKINKDYIAGNFYRHVKEDNKKALYYYDQIADPTDDTLVAKAETLLDLGKKPEALEAFQLALDKAKDNNTLTLSILPILAQLAMEYGRNIEAFSYLHRYYQMNPEGNAHRLEYVHALMNIGRYDLALKEMQALKNANTLPKDQRINYLKSLVMTNQFPEADYAAAQWEAELQPSLAERLRVAQLMTVTKNIDFYNNAIKDTVEKKLISGEEAAELMMLFIKLGDYKHALSIKHSHGKALEQNVDGLMALATLELRLSQLTDALQHAQQALTLQPNNQAVRTFIETYDRSGNTLEQLVALYEEALKQKKENVTLKVSYARALIENAINNSTDNSKLDPKTSAQLLKALNILDRLSNSYPEVPEIYYLLGKVYFLLDNNYSAAEALKKTIALDVSKTDAYQFLSLTQEFGGDLAGAIETLNKGISFEPDNATAWRQLGRIQTAQGNLIDAINSLKQAIRYAPNIPQPYIHLSKLMLQLNNPEDAKAALEKAIKLDPNNIEALELLLSTLKDPTLRVDDHTEEKLKRRRAEIEKKLYDLRSK
ncbi:MAG: tetratricopeptide repeat protein [Chlamydiales bacterium]|nr:tetratricopeptide repeat protein [Chlamydiales bacterium]